MDNKHDSWAPHGTGLRTDSCEAPSMNDRLLTTSEVAAYCQVTNDGVVKWIKAKKLRAYSTPGGHYRIRKSDFREFLEKQIEMARRRAAATPRRPASRSAR